MKIKYLGTAAAEGFPGIFCACKTCLQARQKGGKNIRTRSQAMIDDKILIDFPADTYMHMLNSNIEMYKLKHIIITHSHSDHFYPEDFSMIKEGFAFLDNKETLKVYATKDAYEKTAAMIAVHKMAARAEAVKIDEFKEFQIEDYNILPLKANHDVKSDPVFYSINRSNKNILYANDTGYFFEEVWRKLEENGKIYNLVSLDCTAGLLPKWYKGHMSFDVNLELIEELKKRKLAEKTTKYVITHFSHNCLADYDEMKIIADKYNIIVAYDGMEIDI